MIAKLVDIGLYKGYLYLIKHIYTDIKAFWVIEENHEGEWIEVLKICENQADVDSVVNFYLENRRKSLYEN